jgi:hypothetical protein
LEALWFLERHAQCRHCTRFGVCVHEKATLLLLSLLGRSGFTFDSHLFPYPTDSMDYLHALGLPVTLNIHDARYNGNVAAARLTR